MSRPRVIRWGLSVTGAGILTILTILPIVNSISRKPTEEVPVLLIDYLELPPEKKNEPRKVTRKKKEPKKEVPRHRTMRSPMPSLSKAEDSEPTEQTLISTQASDTAEDKDLNTGDVGVVSVSSPSLLDNVSYEPMGHCPKPKYPSIARRAKITGFVDTELLIDENGRVEEFSFSRVTGHPASGRETAKVLPKWWFPPPRIRGRKVRIRYRYRVSFELD